MEAFLGGEVADDVLKVATLLVSELTADAVRHVHSLFTVTAALLPAG